MPPWAARAIYSHISESCVLIYFTEDVLKARLKTVGVSEYKFEMEVAAKDTPSEWRIVDVGGSRSQVSYLLSSHLVRRC